MASSWLKRSLCRMRPIGSSLENRAMITRAHRIRIACVLGLVGCTPSERSAPVRPIAVVRPGTYELRLCRVVCDVKHPQNVIRSGWVVLDSIPTDTRPFADSVRRVLQARLDFVGIDSASANGCFALQNDRPEIHTLGGALGAGLLHWARTARTDSITFALYGSPDAGYEASVAMTGSGLAGRDARSPVSGFTVRQSSAFVVSSGAQLGVRSGTDRSQSGPLSRSVRRQSAQTLSLATGCRPRCACNSLTSTSVAEHARKRKRIMGRRVAGRPR
jgi:hypothetical protein